MGVLPACESVPCVCSACGQERVSDSLELELQMAVSHYVDAEP